MLGDLAQLWYQKGMRRDIQSYVLDVSPSKALQVVGGLLDVEAPDDYLMNFILSAPPLSSASHMVELCEEVCDWTLKCFLKHPHLSYLERSFRSLSVLSPLKTLSATIELTTPFQRKLVFKCASYLSRGGD